MPTYSYACTECSHAFEQFQSFSDDALTVCPQCQGRLRKLFNAVGVVFKGSGFYRNDSRTSTKEPTGSKEDSSASGESGDAKTSPGSQETSSPAKPKDSSSSGSTASTATAS